jgi:hypothetical protein
MSAIQTMHFGWVRTPSAYESITSWREKHAAARQDFEDTMSAVTSTFGDALANQVSQAGTIAAQRALTRIQAETKAKADAQAAAAARNAPVDPPKVIGSKVTLSDGSSEIDLQSGTLTMADGSTVDLKTGLIKTVDVSV